MKEILEKFIDSKNVSILRELNLNFMTRKKTDSDKKRNEADT